MGNLEKYQAFRKRYPEFIYESYDIERQPGEVKLAFRFSVPGLGEFAPQWTLPMPDNPVFPPESPLFQNLAFQLGLVELISYWKIACPPLVRIKCGFLDAAQQKWWKAQYFSGLGEFFYKNGIDASEEDFMSLQPEGAPLPAGEPLPLKGCMIPVGGGKDSVVTMELLRDLKEENLCYILNPRGATVNTAKLAGFDEKQLVCPRRTLDPLMLELNRQGYLNGHTPFSALVAFSGLLMAAAYGKKYLVLSNESSANEATVAGSSVNHQYSKSFQFEQDFNWYERQYIGSGVLYFSLLRPWSEFQIAAYFARFPQYHSAFRSCNAGSKTDSWCGACPKCLFVWVILSPFLDTAQLEGIFGENLAQKEALWETLRQLCGMTAEKPFECVGSREEICFALTLAVRKMEGKGEPLPLLYRLFKDTEQYQIYAGCENPYFSYFNGEHLLPPAFLERIKAAGGLLQREAGL